MTLKTTLSAMAIAAIAAPALISGAAFAETHADKPHAHARIQLSDFDQNGDGNVTVDEFDAVAAEKMAAWQEWRESRGSERAERAQTPETSNENAADPAHRGMKRGHGIDMPTGADIDTDGDGVISQEEFGAAHTQVRGQWREKMQERRNAVMPNRDEDRQEDSEESSANDE